MVGYDIFVAGNIQMLHCKQYMQIYSSFLHVSLYFCLFASQSCVISGLISSLLGITLPDEFMYPWRMKDRKQLYLSQTKQNLFLIKG